jgi:hypothetical protein
MTLFRTTPFYHQTIERFVVAFGQLFTGMTIQKKDINGNKLQSYEAPIEYAPRNKWISRLREQNDLTMPQVKMTLPRMAFELSDIKYAPERKIGVNGVYAIGNINGMRGKIFPPTPYDVTFSFYVATKDSNDGYQILEQILPYFQPYMTLTYEILPEYRITKDVPVTLVSYQDEDNYDGSPDEQRIEIQTFTFSAQMDFFGPMIISDKIIKEVIIRLGESFNMPTNITLDSTVVPRTAGISDVYTIIDTVNEMI